jgi:hypothetical protein
MVTEVVVKELLSSEMISAGAELTRRLDKAQFIVSASLWYYIAESNTWRFIIASPEVRTHGLKKAYKQVQSIVATVADDQLKIPLKDITVVDSKDPLISLLKGAIKTEAGISGIRFSQNMINSVFIEDVYIYRLR